MPMQYRPEIDGLRAIAVLSVVAYHAAGLPAAGFVGVDVFFVISGYLITALLLREHGKFGRISLVGFYGRRIRRIVPALVVVVAMTLAASSLLLHTAAEKQHVSESALASLAFAGNVFFQYRTGGYFDGASEEMPLLHLWSLGVEEQFYLLWPLLLIVVLRYSRPVPALAMLCVCSLLLAEWQPQQAAFYSMPSRFWELGIGGLIAALPSRQMLAARTLALAGLVGLAVAVALPFASFPGVGAMPAVAGAALVILAVHCSPGLTGPAAILRSRPMVFVGLISYSLYLWHWPLLALDRATRIDPSPMSTRLLLVAASFVLAWLSWRYIETPFRRGHGRRVIAAAIASTLVVGVGAVTARATIEPQPIHAAGDASFPGIGPRMILWGDSHAASMRPLAWAMGDASGASVTTYMISGCLPALGFGTPECVAFNEQVSERAASMDTVVLAGRWLPFFSEIPTPYLQGLPVAKGVQHDARRAGLEHGLRRTITALRGVRRVVIVLPIPQSFGPAPRCAPGQCDMPRSFFDRASAPAHSYLAELAAEHPNVTLFDPTPAFCDSAMCPSVREGTPVFEDFHHPQAHVARAVASLWLKREP